MPPSRKSGSRGKTNCGTRKYRGSRSKPRNKPRSSRRSRSASKRYRGSPSGYDTPYGFIGLFKSKTSAAKAAKKNAKKEKSLQKQAQTLENKQLRIQTAQNKVAEQRLVGRQQEARAAIKDERE